MLGGNITVTSEPGKGSVFSLLIATGAIEGISSLRPGDVTVPESSVDEQASAESTGVQTVGPVREAGPGRGSA